CCLNVQIQYGAKDAFLTRGVHPIIHGSSTPAKAFGEVIGAACKFGELTDFKLVAVASELTPR
ncbi:hypothetical protein L9G15_14695, partial [Shewanella sp. A3A]|nr:hypothetical protein [Shewanella ferrihydritica]